MFCLDAAIIMSFCGISLSMVDYQISLRKSLPDKDEFRVLSKFMYLFYKLLTITSWILSISLITLLSVRISVILMVFLWICGFTWTLKQHTTFCKSKKMEYLYRTVVGIILIFSFFNIKGRRTKVCMSIYYATHTVVTLGILFVYIFWKPSIIKETCFTIVSILTISSLVLGIIFLVVYYSHLHPTTYCRPQACSDEVDGVAGQRERVKTDRFQNFLMQWHYRRFFSVDFFLFWFLVVVLVIFVTLKANSFWRVCFSVIGTCISSLRNTYWPALFALNNYLFSMIQRLCNMNIYVLVKVMFDKEVI